MGICKRRRTGWLVILMVLGLLVSACGQQAAQQPAPAKSEPASAQPAQPAQSAQSAPAKAEPAKPAAKPVELILGHFIPTTHPMHVKLMEPFVKALAEKSGGRIKVTIHPSGALGPAPQQYENVKAGAMDIGFGLPSYTPGRFPLSSVIELPFVFKSGEHATNVFWDLYESSPALQKEFADTKILALWTHDLGELLTRKPVKSLADVKGMKIRSPGPVQNLLLQEMGATPVNMPISDVYDALDRGVADGVVTAYSAIGSFNLDKVVSNATPGKFYVAAFFLTMNRQTWDKLSPEDQKLIDSLAGRQLSLVGAKAYDNAYVSGRDRMLKAGIPEHQMPESEVKQFAAVGQRVAAQWVKDVESKGLPGKELYEKMVKLAGK